jgi:2-oxo-3-hexenedioate decarboxylase/2-keto-4-pentenoate hydratase
MDAKAILRTAQLIGDARIAAEPVPPIPDEDLPQTSEDGYAVQKALNDFLRKNFQGEPVGWKVGATTVSMQHYLGVTEPAYGRIMSGNVIQNGNALPSDNFCNPGIECEIAVRLGRSSNGGKYTRESVTDLIDSVMPAIEIVENRYGDLEDRSTPTLIADDFFHKACVLGKELRDWHSVDLAELIGTVQIDGKNLAEGQGSAIMGHPLEAVAWIANLLSTQGECLNDGDLVMTGSITPVIWVESFPCRAEISFHGLESVSLDLV